MPPNVTKQLDRKLGFWSVYAISMGAMISGIIVLPGLAAGIAGPKVYWSFLLAGLLAMPAVLSKAELATAMPVAGGTYVFVDRSLGPWMGTITGLGTWFSLSAKIAFALVGLGAYLQIFTDISPMYFSLSVLAILVTINILGVSKASGLQIVIVAGCVASLAVLGVAGAPGVNPALAEPAFPTGVSGILSGAAFVFVAYAGVTKIASVAEEVHHPDRNLPLGILASQFTAMALYALLSWLITGHTSYTELADDITPISTTAEAIFGPTGSMAFAIVSVIALISMSNAGILATSRKPFAMSRDDMMPSPLRAVSDRFGTPWVAILATGGLLTCLVLFLPVAKLAKLASGFKIFIFAIINITVIVLRESGARWYQPSFRSPLYPWIQIVGIVGAAWLLYSLGVVGSLGVATAVALGSLWYWAYGRKRVSRRSVLGHLWGGQEHLRKTEPIENEHEVIVPFFGDEPAPERLIHLASAFRETGAVEVLRLEEVPESMDLVSRIDADADGEAIRVAGQTVADRTRVPIAFTDLVTHNAKRALQRHATATQADWIVMEWPTRRALHYLVRHPLAWWIDHAPCDLVVFLDKAGPDDGDPTDDFQRILVLADPGPHDSLLVHVAERIAGDQVDAEVTLLDVLPPDASEEAVAQRRDYHEQLASLCASPCRSRIERARDRFRALAAVSVDYDVMLIGASSERSLRNMFVSSSARLAAAASACSVLKVRAPRHQVHHRFEMRREDPHEQMILTPYLQHALLASKQDIPRKADLFKQVGLQMVAANLCSDADVVVRALQRRERRQNTALREGVAISAPSMDGLQLTQVIVFTLEQAIDYQSPDRPMIDVLIVVLAPHSERQVQLWVLERLARMTIRTDLLPRLRRAEDDAEMRGILLEIMHKAEF